MTARDTTTTKTKTPIKTKTKTKKRGQMTPDPKERKIGDLLNFWQRATRPQKKPDSSDTGEEQTRTRHPVTPDKAESSLTVTDTPEISTVKSLTVMTVQKGPERVKIQDKQRDSPTKTRIREIRQQFRSRVTVTDQTQTRTPPAESKRKAESVHRPAKQRVIGEKRVMGIREGRAASRSGPIFKYFNTNSDQFSEREQGGHGRVDGEVPGRLACKVWEGGDSQGEAQISACSAQNILKISSPNIRSAQPGDQISAVADQPDCLDSANRSRGTIRTVGKTGFASTRLDKN